MSDNQYVFEIIRDVGYLIQNIEKHETVWFHVTNDGDNFFTARSSKGMLCGLSETSRAIEKAYQVTRNRPDVRDTEIANLREALEWYKKEAAGLSNNLTLKKMDAVEAGMVVLSLDGGNRALKALSKEG